MSEVPFWAANFAAHVALIMAAGTDVIEAKAPYFNNAAAYLSELGWREEALAAAQEAVKLRRATSIAAPKTVCSRA
jgi:hypothetical protein